MYEEISNAVVERLVRRQEKANERILKEIGKILGEIGNLTPSKAYTIGQQLKYGESLEKIVKILSETSKINEVEIYRMLEEEARKNLDLKKIYFKAKKVDFIPYSKNAPLKNLVNQIARTTLKSYRNISQTTALTFLDINGNKVTRGIGQAYNQIVDDAILNVATGKETFYEAMKNQLKTIGQAGVQTLEYEGGYHRRIDSALRMNLQDGLNQLAIAQQELVGEQFGYDGWEITVHSFPAPDHLFQGHIFDKDEYKKLQDYNYFGNIKDINGNIYTRSSEERIRPVGTLNCYHQAWSIVIGVDRPRYSEEELNKIIENNNKGFEYEGKKYKTLYDATQKQRQIELAIRRNREEEIGLKASYEKLTGENKEKIKIELDKNRKRTRELLTKYHDFSSKAGLPSKLERARLLTK